MELAETLNPGGNLVRRSQAARAADGRAPAIAREDLRARSIWRALERGLACTQADRVQRGPPFAGLHSLVGLSIPPEPSSPASPGSATSEAHAGRDR